MKNSKISMSSNKSFGIVFFIFFFILGIWPSINGNQINYILLILGFIFLILGLFNSKILTPLNFVWCKLGIYLGIIISPIIMGIIFFLIVTPIGVFMRLMGKDLIRNKKNKSFKTYWIERQKEKSSMKNQF